MADDLSTIVGLRLKVWDLLGFRRDTQQAAQGINQIKRAADETAHSSQNASQGIFSWQRSMRWLVTGTFVAGVWQLVGAIKAAAVNIVQTGLAFNAMKENALITFRVLTGSAEKAQRLFKGLMQLALESPFDPANVQQGAQMLLTFGFHANQIIPIMRRLADVSAANPLFGPEVVQHLALVLGQIKSSNRLLGQDANQLAQFGINAYSVVAKRLYGVASSANIARVRALGQQGKLESGFVIDSIMKYIDVRYKGLAKQVSLHSYTGITSNLRQAYQTAAGALLAPAMPGIERNLQRLQNYLGSPQFLAKMRAFDNALVKIWHAIGPLVVGFGMLAIAIIKLIVGPIIQIIKILSPVLVPILRTAGFFLQWLSKQTFLLTVVLLLLTGPIKAIAEGVIFLNEATLGAAIFLGKLLTPIRLLFSPLGELLGHLSPIIDGLKWLKTVTRISLLIDIAVKAPSWLPSWLNRSGVSLVQQGFNALTGGGGSAVTHGISARHPDPRALAIIGLPASLAGVSDVRQAAVAAQYARTHHIHVNLHGREIADAVYDEVEGNIVGR